MSGETKNVLASDSSAIEPGHSPSRTDCPLLPLVSAYHDHELPDARLREVEDHLASCSICSGSLKVFQRMSECFVATSFPELTEQNRHDLELVAADGLGGPAGRVGTDVRWVRRLTAAAAVLFLFAMGRVIYQHAYPQVPTQVVPAVHHHSEVAPDAPSGAPADFSPSKPLSGPARN